jgi:hypothetical protein
MTTENRFPIVKAIEKAIGQRVHIQTARRWCKKGVRGIRLESQIILGQYYSTIEAVNSFIAQTTEARLEVAEPPKVEILKPVKASRVDRAIKEFNKLAKAK